MLNGPGDTTDIEDNFGVDGYSVETNDEGGQHHTVFDSGGGSDRFSWDTDRNGNYVDGSAHNTPQ